jgi:hypothetical protein
MQDSWPITGKPAVILLAHCVSIAAGERITCGENDSW